MKTVVVSGLSVVFAGLGGYWVAGQSDWKLPVPRITTTESVVPVTPGAKPTPVAIWWVL